MRYKFGLMGLLLLSGAQIRASETGCAPTVAGAVERYLAQEQSGGAEGFRVVGVRADRLRGSAWALVERCGRPELPQVSVKLPGALRVMSAARADEVLVRAGERVDVVMRSGATHMELQGWVEEAGRYGGSVRVRLAKVSDEDGPEPRIMCRVLGMGRVEVAE